MGQFYSGANANLWLAVVNEPFSMHGMDVEPGQSLTGVVVREESSNETAAIRATHDAAFGRDAEGRLVDRLRSDGVMIASFVAVLHDTVVANAVFSNLTVSTSSGSIRAAALAPVAVRPEYQRRLLGSSVIVHGLRLCAERGYEAVFVVGDPAYYTRFGFSSEKAKRVCSPYSGAGTAWMALEFRPSVLSHHDAVAHYPDAFLALS